MKSLGASLHLGAVLYETGTTFRVWAPRCKGVEVVIEGRRPTPLTGRADGLFELALPGVGPGTRYQYRLHGERYPPRPGAPPPAGGRPRDLRGCRWRGRRVDRPGLPRARARRPRVLLFALRHLPA